MELLRDLYAIIDHSNVDKSSSNAEVLCQQLGCLGVQYISEMEFKHFSVCPDKVGFRFSTEQSSLSD